MRRIIRHPSVRKHVAQGLKFALSGGLGAVIDLTSLTFLIEVLDIEERLAVIPSTGLAVVVVFLLHKHFTFKSHDRNYGSQAAKFAVVYGVAIASNIVITTFLITVGVHYFLSKIIAIGIGAVWNYSLTNGFVFRKNEEVPPTVF